MGAVTYHVYCRAVFNTLALLLHSGNGLAMYFALQGDVLNDPGVRSMKEIQFKYITIWNMMFQIIFLTMSLICDVPLILRILEYSKYLDYLRSYKKVFFSSIVWPVSVTIFVVFWPTFIYNRELIFPAYIDKALSIVSNHIMHSAILPIVLWEIFFQPRSKPSSHKWYIAHYVAVVVSYLIVLFANYAERGIWPYPIFAMLYGTMYFTLVIISVPVLGLCFYFLQWPLTTLIFETCLKSNKIK